MFIYKQESWLICLYVCWNTQTREFGPIQQDRLRAHRLVTVPASMKGDLKFCLDVLLGAIRGNVCPCILGSQWLCLHAAPRQSRIRRWQVSRRAPRHGIKTSRLSCAHKIDKDRHYINSFISTVFFLSHSIKWNTWLDKIKMDITFNSLPPFSIWNMFVAISSMLLRFSILSQFKTNILYDWIGCT